MTDGNAKIELKIDKNNGPMPRYDDPKPICFRCKVDTWVMSTGRNKNWTWNCINCVTEFQRNNGF